MNTIILLGITSLLTDISTEMVYPLIPIYLVSVLGASPAILGLVEGIAESLASLLKVFSGYFSDRIKKRKPFALIGYGASTIGKVFLFAATSWPMVFLGRVIDRFGKGIRTAPRDALIAESIDANKKGRAFGLHRAMDSFGAAVGVLIAYFLLSARHTTLPHIFLISLIPAVLAVMLLFLVKERSSTQAVSKKEFRFCWKELDVRLKLFLVFSFIFTLGNSSNQFLLLRAKDLGNPLPVVLLMYLVYNVVYALSAYPAARLSDKIGRRKIIVAGYVCYALVYGVVAFTVEGRSFWVLFAIYGLYMGFTDGVEKALLADMAPANLKATVLGTHAAIVGLGLFPASFIAGILWKFIGPQGAFLFGAVMSIIAGIGFWRVLKKD